MAVMTAHLAALAINSYVVIMFTFIKLMFYVVVVATIPSDVQNWVATV